MIAKYALTDTLPTISFYVPKIVCTRFDVLIIIVFFFFYDDGSINYFSGPLDGYISRAIFSPEFDFSVSADEYFSTLKNIMTGREMKKYRHRTVAVLVVIG